MEKTEALSKVKSSGKTKRYNLSKGRFRSGLNPADEMVVEYVNANGRATVKELAAALFNGDYLKAKNAVRRPRDLKLIRFGKGAGEYMAVVVKKVAK